ERGLPLKAASCDLLTALDLFEHLRDPMYVLHEVRRVLSEDGKAYVKICHPRHPNATRDPSHINVQPLSYWTRTFREAGFLWRRVYEADVTGGEGRLAWAKAAIRRLREWAVIGTPADYKFFLWRA
ncbi:MAG TPA: methyltransferase domain-containing protein, partial [Nitrospiraceae bacterium]|nr:methyltransferase domain-containing protein [Nitrospiraceae bacterium]